MVHVPKIRTKREPLDEKYRGTKPVRILHSQATDETSASEIGLLGEARMLLERLVYRKNTICQIQSQMLELDSLDGKLAAQKYLDALQALLKELGGTCDPRYHRMQFSQSYRKMMPDRTAFLVDILDSA